LVKIFRSENRTEEGHNREGQEPPQGEKLHRN